MAESKTLSFLQSSARLLSNQSSSTSAYLMDTSHQSSLRQSNPLTVAQHKDACLSCGTLRVPGITCKIVTRSKKREKSINKNRRGRQKPSQRDNTAISTTEVAFKCMRCHREAVQRIPKQQKHHISINKIPHATIPTTPAGVPVPQTEHAVRASSDNAGSKKRAKARKQQGLLASLSAGKLRPQPQTSSTPLDLLDFFQSS